MTIEANFQLSIDGFDRFADLFFDNIFTDWAVRDRINQSQMAVARLIDQINAVLSKLEMKEEWNLQELERKKKHREQLLVEAKL